MCHSLIVLCNFYNNPMLSAICTVFKIKEMESQIICPNPHGYAVAEHGFNTMPVLDQAHILKNFLILLYHIW